MGAMLYYIIYEGSAIPRDEVQTRLQSFGWTVCEEFGIVPTIPLVQWEMIILYVYPPMLLEFKLFQRVMMIYTCMCVYVNMPAIIILRIIV